MYSLYAYGSMIQDRIRMDAYAEALRRAVRPGDVVLDIGTGTGIHALMAARLGARHVYAVEPAESVLLAGPIARANDLADRITFMQDLSTRITLPERAAVIVSDLHGALPWYHAHIPTIVDARRRLLAEGGTLIPQRDVVYLTAVEAEKQHAGYVHPWTERPFGFDMELAASVVTSHYSRQRIGSEAFLAEPRRVAELDYLTIEDPNVSVSVELPAMRSGTMHGLLAWFETQVFEEIRLTSAPSEPEIAYGAAFFPFTAPVPVETGDSLRVMWRGTRHADDYIWEWKCDVVASDGSIRAHRHQDSFHGQILSLADLRKRAPSYRPRLGSDGEIERAILGLIDGERTLEEIARALQGSMPAEFASAEDALERVRAVSARFG
jgi:type I protein arginine methyltransferase